MSDPKKELELTEIWARAGVRMDITMLRPTNIKKNNKKKKGTSTSGGQPESETVIDLEARPAAQPAEQREDTMVQALPSSSNAAPEANKKRPRDNFSTSAINLKKQKESIEERLAESGKLPSISGLQACLRVGQSGMDLFNELAELIAGEMRKRLEGKISKLNVENRHLKSAFSGVTNELSVFHDQNLTSFSEDNRGLKEELERLRKVEEDLNSAKKKVAEQKKQLKRLPAAEKELQETRNRVEEVRLGNRS